MNDYQKKAILLALGLFLLSVLYIPNGFTHQGVTIFSGWTFIWDMSHGIDLKVLFSEWIFICFFSGGLILYFK